MKHLKKTFALFMLLTFITGSQTLAQQFLKFATAGEQMQQLRAKQRAKEVLLDNEYQSTGHEQGIFLSNPLLLDGKPLDYSTFGLSSKGKLTVTKPATINGQSTAIPFYVYLRRNDTKVLIPGKERPDPRQVTVEISELLKEAKKGDHLIIEPVNREDGPAKRILKLLENDGC